MKEFIIYYYINLWRSKEQNMPLGLMALGRFGYFAFRFFPFDFFAYFVTIFFIQWFCFGLTSEILENFDLTYNGLLLPSIGLGVSLFLFDFVHFSKSFYYNFKYRGLVSLSYRELVNLKTINEICGGKLISILVFFIFYLYYYDFLIKDLLLIAFIYFSYNSIILLLSNILFKRNFILYAIFFSVIFGLTLIFNNNSLSFERSLMENEKWFYDFLFVNNYYLFAVGGLLIVSQYIYNLQKIKKDVFV